MISSSRPILHHQESNLELNLIPTPEEFLDALVNPLPKSIDELRDLAERLLRLIARVIEGKESISKLESISDEEIQRLVAIRINSKSNYRQFSPAPSTVMVESMKLDLPKDDFGIVTYMSTAKRHTVVLSGANAISSLWSLNSNKWVDINHGIKQPVLGYWPDNENDIFLVEKEGLIVLKDGETIYKSDQGFTPSTRPCGILSNHNLVYSDSNRNLLSFWFEKKIEDSISQKLATDVVAMEIDQVSKQMWVLLKDKTVLNLKTSASNLFVN